MRIVNSTDVPEGRFGITGAVRMLCEAGFDGIDYCMCKGEDRPVYGKEYLKTLRLVKEIADGFGAVFSQTHGPIPKYQLDDAAGRERFMSAARRSIEATAALGAPHVVLHPMRVARGDHEEQLKINLTEYSPLVEEAKKCGVKIALENMCGYKTNESGEPVKHVCKTAEEHARYVDAFGSDAVIACLDTGHAWLSAEEPCEFARTLGARLGALHVHDNGGVRDNHTLPYSAEIKFAPLLKALADIDYGGDFTLECNYYLKPDFPEPLFAPALKYMAELAAYMRDEILKMKRERG